MLIKLLIIPIPLSSCSIFILLVKVNICLPLQYNCDSNCDEEVFFFYKISFLFQVISSDSVERQPESLIIGKRKPSLGLELQFQNKFRLGNEVLPKQGRKNVIIRGKMIGGAGGRGGGSQSGVGGGNNNRYKQTRHPPHYSSYCDPCTDYLNSPMFQSLHSRWVDNCYSVINGGQ